MTYNTDMSTLPVLCPSCFDEIMVDMDNLEKQYVDKVASRLGTACTNCGVWITISYTTRLLEDALKKLENRTPNSAGYHYHFAKALKKCEGVQEKYGGF
jgi:hypothetical protein